MVPDSVPGAPAPLADPAPEGEGASTVDAIAAFALGATSADLRAPLRERLKQSVLDALGCALGALGHAPVQAVRALVDELGGAPRCALIGGGRSAPDRAALYNGCLVRYLDFMDNTARQGEVCHPSDNLAALLSAAELADATGEDLLVALAVAYQVQTRLLELPTMRAGINYTTPLAFSVAAGAARLLALDARRTAHALALAGVGAVSLAAIQAEPVSQWKGLASGEAASRALHNTLLARNGITGPTGVFDGPMGLYRLVGARLSVDWASERLDPALPISLKKHNAEFQAQTAVELALQLRAAHPMEDREVARIGVTVPEGAYAVIGGGEYGPKDKCLTKEQADHNLRYLVAVAWLDGEVGPAQFTDERIGRADVQALLRRVEIRPDAQFTARTPDEMPVAMTVEYADGKDASASLHDYDGFHARPMDWTQTEAKFRRLTEARLSANEATALIDAVHGLETLSVRELAAQLEAVGSRGNGKAG